MSPWTALVPVKPWRLAKSRLDLPARERRVLARAFTLDLLEVLARTPDVARTVVVTDEDELTPLARERGAIVLPDTAAASPDGLNNAIASGRAWAANHHGMDALAVVPADLPCLTPADLTAALSRLGVHHRAFVPDSNDHGTTIVAATRPDDLTWDYGGASAERHRRLEMTEVVDVASGVRHDVDTLDALTTASELGIGGHGTRAALTIIGASVRSGTMAQ